MVERRGVSETRRWDQGKTRRKSSLICKRTKTYRYKFRRQGKLGRRMWVPKVQLSPDEGNAADSLMAGGKLTRATTVFDNYFSIAYIRLVCSGGPIPQRALYGARAIAEKTSHQIVCRTELRLSKKSRTPVRGFYLQFLQFGSESSSTLLRP
jgi:hypothetical protein